MEFDQFRLPYAADDSKFPRRTVFAASVNRPDFLLDDTGNSRFWTIPVTGIRHDHNIDMQQVYAQLRQTGGQWWLTHGENGRLGELNEKHEERDEVYDLVTSRIDWRETETVDWMTPTDVLIAICRIERPTKAQRNSCARILRQLTGMERGKRRKGSPPLFPIPKIPK